MEQAISIGQHSSTWQVQEDLEAGLQGIMAVREVNVEREPPFTVIFTGRLLCDAETALPILEQRFAAAGCVPLIRRHGQDDMVVAVEHTARVGKQRIWLNLLLFGATFVTTTAAGAALVGADVWRNPAAILVGPAIFPHLVGYPGHPRVGPLFHGQMAWGACQPALFHPDAL